MNVFKPQAMKTVFRWSAGGVVVRATNDERVEVAIVGRLGENLWALPKGTPDDGESVEETAIREVQEETGLKVSLVSTVDETQYSFVRSIDDPRRSERDDPRANLKIKKTVYWFLMESQGGHVDLHDHEYDVALWVDIDDAVNRLTFNSEAKVAAAAAHVYRRLRATRDAIRIKGELVTLRSKRVEDAWRDYCWRTDPLLSELDAATPIGMSFIDYERAYQEDLRLRRSNSIKFAIEDETGNHIGNCMCYDLDEYRRQAEFGIMIGERNYWDKGYGADATRTLLAHAFESLELRRLYLHTLASNRRAQKSFENAGFKPFAKVRREGKNFVQMEAFARDWRFT